MDAVKAVLGIVAIVCLLAGALGVIGGDLRGIGLFMLGLLFGGLRVYLGRGKAK